MKTMYKTLAHGDFTHSAEFQAEARELKQSISQARGILSVRSRDAYMDFVEGPLMLSMQCSLVSAFPVPPQHLDRFSNDVMSILADVRGCAESAFGSAVQKCRHRPGKSLLAYDWNALKSDLHHKLREVAPHVAELHRAAHDVPVTDRNALRPGI